MKTIDERYNGKLTGHFISYSIRNDGKFKTTYAWPGKRINKILTREQLDAAIQKILIDRFEE